MTDERDEALRPCPFCGGDARPDSVPNGAHYAHCADCGAEGPVHESERGAIAAWNARLARAQPQQEPVEWARPIEPFVVKRYSADERPILKGNGFDGLEVGEDRDEAEHFVQWLNPRLGFPPSPPAQAVPEGSRGTPEYYRDLQDKAARADAAERELAEVREQFHAIGGICCSGWTRDNLSRSPNEWAEALLYDRDALRAQLEAAQKDCERAYNQGRVDEYNDAARTPKPE